MLISKDDRPKTESEALQRHAAGLHSEVEYLLSVGKYDDARRVQEERRIASTMSRYLRAVESGAVAPTNDPDEIQEIAG